MHHLSVLELSIHRTFKKAMQVAMQCTSHTTMCRDFVPTRGRGWGGVQRKEFYIRKNELQDEKKNCARFLLFCAKFLSVDLFFLRRVEIA